MIVLQGVIVDGPSWPADAVGREVQTIGTIRRDMGSAAKNDFVALGAIGRLVRLDDQLNHHVELRGTAWSLNGHWWFDYRGQQIYVDRMDQLPHWNAENHGRPMIVRGTLYRAKRPDLAQITLKTHPDLKDYFVI